MKKTCVSGEHYKAIATLSQKEPPNNGHWYYPQTINPEAYYGFIYRITNLLTCQQYVGKKSFHTWNRTGTKKTGKAKWEDYCSSSTEVKASIKELGKDWFHFEVLALCCTKSCWSYSESNIMHKLDVLTTRDESGMRWYLNKAINKIQWIPKHCNAINIINKLSNEEPKESGSCD
jgi:hypothetical protein